jgi:hypothetical protein
MAIDRSQAYFWTKRWQQAEREVDEDLQAGRYQDFNSMNELIRALEDDMNDECSTGTSEMPDRTDPWGFRNPRGL